MELIEITVSILILGFISRYITYVTDLLGIVVHPYIMKFIFLVLAISIIQYIVARKDD